MDLQIVLIDESHIDGFHAAADSVAREHMYLAMTQAPTLESTTEFIRTNISLRHTQFVALVDGTLVGWCDALPHWADGMRHRAMLGIAVIEQYRGKGIGRALLTRTLEQAAANGILRVDLEVRSDNLPAIALYASVGFLVEGRKVAGLRLDGAMHDVLCMGKMLNAG